MNKVELVNALSTKIGTTKTEAEKMLNCFMEVVTNTLAKQEEINLIGFGKFYVTKREACTGRNPRTGKPINIAAYNTPKFKAGKVLKSKVNK